ncbi:hypothetical protein JCGZ_02938 [Jatropha curcas]|uniref:C2H2-type domain-containing protein n=1 Tax=Jatropha curcas TaxID=180498 RepID=A0A067L4U8_JATCU|nr:zinc finger protein 10 [Jatropha curcas]KDP42208.1 hypothetical protein JCGZ_02938 [Jatropha curcas]
MDATEKPNKGNPSSLPLSPMDATEKPNQENPGGESQVRSYECTFCNRGFANSQALGGHMNIHRKDKAQLKQHSIDYYRQLCIEIPKNTVSPSFPPYPSMADFNKSSQNLYSSINWAWFHNPQQPQLLQGQKSGSGGEMGSPSSPVPKVDLELRLGPEPQGSSSPPPATDKKRFF